MYYVECIITSRSYILFSLTDFFLVFIKAVKLSFTTDRTKIFRQGENSFSVYEI